MSPPGRKAGERIRTADVQLGKWEASHFNYSLSKWLRRSRSAGAELGAGRVARYVYECHLLPSEINQLNCLTVLSDFGINHNTCSIRPLRHKNVIGRDAVKRGQIQEWPPYSVSSHSLIFLPLITNKTNHMHFVP